MSLVGHFAEGVAGDFNSLLDLISTCANDLENRFGELPRFESCDDFEQSILGIKQSAEIALTMTRLLQNLADNPVHRPELLPMSRVVEETGLLLRQLAGTGIDFSLECAPDVGAVFGDHNQIEQLLVNLVLNAKERLAERGTIRIVIDNVTRNKSFVRLRVRAEQSVDADQLWASLTFPFQMDSPPLSLSLVGAIVTAAEGSISSHNPSETSNEVEILLPRSQIELGAGNSRLPSTPRSVILVGLGTDVAKTIHAGLKQNGYIVFETQSVKDAILVAALYGGEISAVIADGRAAAAGPRKRLKARLSDQRHPPVLLQLAFTPELTVDGWRTLVKPIDIKTIAEAVEFGSYDTEPKRLAATLP